MIRITILILIAMVCHENSIAQKFVTKTGLIRFYSDAPLEKIEATNRQVNAALDLSTGNFVFKVVMKSFQFEKALMQEHFNENYVESDKYPNATFSGMVSNFKDIDVKKDGAIAIMVEGKMTMHGVTKSIKEKGTFEIRQGKIAGKAKFNLLLSDFNIKIPTAVVKNISETVEITVDVLLEPITK
jgi:polyisoprenoid-binding protein YceI